MSVRRVIAGVWAGLLFVACADEARADLGSVFAAFATSMQSQLMSVLGPILGVVALLISAALGISIFLWLAKKIG